ncbi:uncharacterized protein LOC128209452 [Mya arenaria]|uniref:uncharacterized protein LOC128209452 n=1 Tax=Mya arenaria TaxID=6604 RepID=UPI0022E6E076|nr:uncharacterized protein LOC128209452 [Mya arenaria]
MARLSKLTQASMAVTFLGAIAMLKSFQDVRYFKSDAMKITAVQASERDMEKLVRKYHISEEQLKAIKEEKKEQSLLGPVPDNLLETDPTFQHKRVTNTDLS